MKNKNGWINAKKEQPKLVEGENYSPNVLAVCDGELMVMCYVYMDGEDGGFFWANCCGYIDGDPELDDDYDVIWWQYFPSIDGLKL